jgi:sugar lactone lactonase YvrE
VTDVRATVAAEPVGDATAVLGEGPYWSVEDGCLLWVDERRAVLHQTHVQDGETTSIELDKVAAVFPASGGGVLTVGGNRLTLRADGSGEGWSGRTVAEVHARNAVVLNDGSVDPAGRVWVGELHSGYSEPLGKLYRLDPGGTMTPVLTGVTISNGIAWSPDGSRMYYTDSLTRRIDLFDYDAATGEAAQRRVFADLSSVDGLPDGLTVDADGCVWVAMALGSALRRFTPSGSHDAVVPLPVSTPTSCAFGGPDLSELYVTTASIRFGEEPTHQLDGRLLRLRPGSVGLPATTTAARIPT